MNGTVKAVTVKGYNKKHTFSIERTSVAGYNFVRLMKNGNVILNCKAHEFEKFRQLFI